MRKMINKNPNLCAMAAAVLAASLGIPAFAQTSTSNQAPPPSPNAQVQTGASASGTSNGMNPGDNSTYATGKPLPTKTNEGFWGHLNPLARKKWVNRQVGPVKDRLNELDQLTAKNSNDIKDLDARATAGIQKAQTTADGANQTCDDGQHAGRTGLAAGAAGFHPDGQSEHDGLEPGSVCADRGHGDSLPQRPDNVECKGQRGPG